MTKSHEKSKENTRDRVGVSFYHPPEWCHDELDIDGDNEKSN